MALNLYYKKQRWKLMLLLLAGVIVGISMYFTNRLAQNVKKEEENKARLWAETIEEKAEFVAYTNNLFEKIEEEERKNVEMWGKGFDKVIHASDNDPHLGFFFDIVRNNTTIPVILINDNYNYVNHKNLADSIVRNEILLKKELELMKSVHEPIQFTIPKTNKKNYLYYKNSKIFEELKTARDELIQSFTNDVIQNSANVPVIYVDSASSDIIAHSNFTDLYKGSEKAFLKEKKGEMQEDGNIIRVNLGEAGIKYIYYEDSLLLKQLQYFPIIQFIIIGVFLVVAYILFSTARKAEQNQVWVGMSKETAHQLGTPLSSLMAWLEILKMKLPGDQSVLEIAKDISRLETITERFSKIGSAPKLEQLNLVEVLTEALDYLRVRLSQKVEFNVESEEPVIPAAINRPLFEWVIENLSKNAVDAMGGQGKLTFRLAKSGKTTILDIIDTGKGIPKSRFKTIFQPGYTSKKRGWGLGLTLVKRIVENYHNGKIYVKHSEIDKGTNFRIVLNAQMP